MKSSGAWLVAAMLIVPAPALAEHRLAIEPSIDVIEVHDDNLNFSADEPMGDRIRRITPTLALRFDSPRWSARGTFGLDSEHFATHSNLDNDRARERGRIGVQYLAGPRLTLSIDSAYVDTNTLADLNVDTGLAASRVRGRSLSAGSSARFRVSPRMIATVSTSSLATNVVNGVGMRSQVQAIILQQSVTPRDLFNVHYENIHFGFHGATSQRIHTQFLLGRWIHEFGMHDRVTVQVGPRVTDGSRSVDVAAILSHTWRFSSIALSFLRNQTTVIGYAGAVDTEVVQTKFYFTPNRRLTAYATPAIYRSTHAELEGRVYRVAIGARYAITSLVDADVAYNRDTQNGAIDPLRPNAAFSHATLSVGFTTRWSSTESHGAERMR